MKKIKLNALTLALLILMASCANLKVVAKYDSDSVEPHKATRTTYFWGLKSPTDVPAKCDSQCICKVKTKTNAGQLLLTVITLGIVIPQSIEWECCRPPMKDNKLE